MAIFASFVRHLLQHSAAAKAALRRKKQHENSLEQTVAQISQLEAQIYSIEAANINPGHREHD